MSYARYEDRKAVDELEWGNNPYRIVGREIGRVASYLHALEKKRDNAS